MARPMPLAAPVTIAAFPWRSTSGPDTPTPPLSRTPYLSELVLRLHEMFSSLACSLGLAGGHEETNPQWRYADDYSADSAEGAGTTASGRRRPGGRWLRVPYPSGSAGQTRGLHADRSVIRRRAPGARALPSPAAPCGTACHSSSPRSDPPLP